MQLRRVLIVLALAGLATIPVAAAYPTFTVTSIPATFNVGELMPSGWECNGGIAGRFILQLPARTRVHAQVVPSTATQIHWSGNNGCHRSAQAFFTDAASGDVVTVTSTDYKTTYSLSLGLAPTTETTPYNVASVATFHVAGDDTIDLKITDITNVLVGGTYEFEPVGSPVHFCGAQTGIAVPPGADSVLVDPDPGLACGVLASLQGRIQLTHH